MAAVTICSDFGAQKNKVCHCFHCFPIYLPWSDGTRCHDLIFWMLSFKPNFSLSSLIFIKWLFSSSSLSVIRVVSSAYMRLLIFLLAIYIPACAWYNQSVLKEISPEYSLEGLMLKLKLQYLTTWCEELTHWKRPWCWERLKAGEEGDDEDEMVWWHNQLNGHEFE